ncbi:MAG: regulatory protein GemA [Desulfobulbaceae bacterium]|nr:regulatory protein GemA [Desulfobulbaceae bacterium]
MPSRADFAKIHIAKKELGLNDEAYRDLLYFQFSKSSSKDLTFQEVGKLLSFFRTKGWKPKYNVKKGRKGSTKSTNFKEITGPNAQQKRYILALWNNLGYDVAKLDARCKKQFGVERFEWLNEDRDLFVLVTDLRQRNLDAGIDPEPV